jgi:hypothetical protein
MADQELDRRQAIEEKLQYISRQIGRLEVINQVPSSEFECDQLVNRATDVISASLAYIAISIRRESATLGVIGCF